MSLEQISSLEFLTYLSFAVVALACLWRLLPGKPPPVRSLPYSEQELTAHDAKLAKYFVAGAGFLVLGAAHMVVKNVPAAADWLARTGEAGHLVRDLSNTHVMIVGGGTLVATGLCWYALPRITGRPLTSEALAHASFWLTAVGLLVFYVALVANGIAMGRLIERGVDYEEAKASMGGWYRLPVGAGAGVMGLGYWCFAANVFLTVFQARLVRVPKPSGHLWKFFVAGAAALTVGTVQGVIQVQPANEDWLRRAGHAGEWIDPISHAHVNLVTGLTMLAAGLVFALVRSLGGTPPSRRLANACFFVLLTGSVGFYGAALYLGFHEGRLVVARGITSAQAEAATPLHPYLIVGTGVAMLAGFWLLLALLVRAFWTARGPMRGFVLAGCGALAVGTLQGPIQALPGVNERLERGGDAGDVVVNLHAQLNMLGGVMVLLVGAALVSLTALGAAWRPRAAKTTLLGISFGIAAYYASGLAFALAAARAVAHGQTFRAALARFEPWHGIALSLSALAALAGFAAYGSIAWQLSAKQLREGRRSLATAPARYAGRIPTRIRRRRPAAAAAYELPLGLLGFPGIGWLFAGFPITAVALLLTGPALAWAVIPLAFSPHAGGPLRSIGWKIEFVWLGVSAVASAAVLYAAHRHRRLRLVRPPPRTSGRGGYRARVGVAVGGIALVLVALPFVPAVTQIGASSVRYTYQTRLEREITGPFLVTPRGAVKLYAWRDPQGEYPRDTLRVHPADVRSLLFRAAAVDRGGYRLFDLERSAEIPLDVRRLSARSVRLTPRFTLESGKYVLVTPRPGMFGGRDFSYVTVVPAAAPATAISVRPDATAPAVVDALLPLVASMVALLFSILLLRSFLRRRAGEKLLWALGFVLFAIATAAQALAVRDGWSPGLFRTYYLAGGVLTVAYLGAGSAWLLLPRRARDALLGGLLVATAAAALTVMLARLDGRALAAAASGQPPVNEAVQGHAFLWAIALNSLGTLCLVGGSLVSILRRRRVRANVWIGGGALVVALATGVSRAGVYELVYAGELVGIALMFAGFTVVGRRPATATRRRPKVAQVGAVPAAAGPRSQA